MKQILEAVQAIDLVALKVESFKDAPCYSPEQVSGLENLNRAAEDCITDRLNHVKTIAKMMHLAAQDKDVGTFDMDSVCSLAFFLESEMETLLELDYIKDVSGLCIHKAKLVEATKRGNGNG